MNKKCLTNGLALFIISLPAALIFSIWTGYMIGTVLSFANYQLIPYKGSNPVSINLLGCVATMIFYFYILFFKVRK